MNQINHCQLCDNSKWSLQHGIICGLTDKKAEFGVFCEKISLGHNMLTKIEQICFEDKLTQSRKWLSLVNFLFFMLLSGGIFSAGLVLWGMIQQKGIISTVPFIIMFIALSLLPLAIGPLRKYSYERSSNRKRINEINEVLSKYGFVYESSVEMAKQNHNILEIVVQITVRRGEKVVERYSNRFDYNNNEKRIENYSFGSSLAYEEIKGLSVRV